MRKSDKYEIVSEIARRRGFFWPSFEIYGGVGGFLTYGPLGSVLKRKIESEFRTFFMKPLGITEIETPIVTPSKVFEASGHVEAFREPMVECLKCKKKFRADHLLQEKAKMSDTQTEKLSLQEIATEIVKHKIKCVECGSLLSKPKYFMTMFTTAIGPYSDSVGYGRPEAAQGAFVEFRRLYETARERLPLGIAQIGHALRNEISPRQGPIRLREFTIADIEFLFDPKEPRCPFLKDVENETLRLIPAALKEEADSNPIEITAGEALQKNYVKTEWQAYFMVLAKQFLGFLGVPADKQRFIEKLEWERAHYSAQGYDQEVYLDRWKWTEVSGHNYRTDYDLKQHMKHSGVDMRLFKEYRKPVTKKETSIEPALSKMGPSFKDDIHEVLTLLSQVDPKEFERSLKKNGHYLLGRFKILPSHVKIIHKTVEETGRRDIPHVVEPSFGIDRLVYVALEYAYDKQNNRTILKLPRALAPIQTMVLPLVSKNGIAEKAKQLLNNLTQEGFEAGYDDAGSIGRRYARADESGTPLCITIDYQTFKDDTVTVRDRDSWRQIRIAIEDLADNLESFFRHQSNFEDLK